MSFINTRKIGFLLAMQFVHGGSVILCVVMSEYKII